MKELVQLLLSVIALVACGLSSARAETVFCRRKHLNSRRTEGLALHKVTVVHFVQEQNVVQNQLFQTGYQKNTDNFYNTFNLNTQHQSNVSTSICKVGGETKSNLPPIAINGSYPPSLLLSSGKSLEYRG